MIFYKCGIKEIKDELQVNAAFQVYDGKSLAGGDLLHQHV
jgi:hypothetical protein